VDEQNTGKNSSVILRYSLMAFPLAFLGIPLYMHLPKFYHDYYGLSLEFIGVILFASRLLDTFVDPLFGVLSDTLHLTQTKYFICFILGLVFFFNAFFYLDKHSTKGLISLWFSVCTICVYLFFTLVFINYYNLGLYISNDDSLKVKLSSFRELSSFLGMIFAFLVPVLLVRYFADESKAFIVYGLIFAATSFTALLFLPKITLQKSVSVNRSMYKLTIERLIYVFSNSSMRWLIIIFFINTMPVAITSNLLSFYLDKTLNAENSMALFLISYLLAGALGAFICSLFLKTANKVNSLLLMMVISAISFSITYFLEPATSNIFYLVCIISGFGIGGELVMFPAIASDVLKGHESHGNTFFALWASCTKMTLALSAGVFLPLIAVSDNFLTSVTLGNKLKFYYAVIPLIIKFMSIIMVIVVKSKSTRGLG
jgi:GPH family glycoside/pentoside/hexuronide:cation symporter